MLTNSLQKLLGGFVGRVLGDEATLECPLEDALPQPGGSLYVGIDLDFDLIHDREAAINLSDYAVFFRQRRYRDSYFSEILKVNVLQPDAFRDHSSSNLLRRQGVFQVIGHLPAGRLDEGHPTPIADSIDS